jgi:hypothetical protein
VWLVTNSGDIANSSDAPMRGRGEKTATGFFVSASRTFESKFGFPKVAKFSGAAAGKN